MKFAAKGVIIPWIVTTICLFGGFYFFSEDVLWLLLALVGVVGSYVLYKSDWFKYLFPPIFLLVPFSIEMPIGGGTMMNFPLEGLLAVVFFPLIFWILEKEVLLKSYFKRPLFWVIVLFWLVLWFTTLFSSQPVVSFKFSTVNMVFSFVGVGGAIFISQQDKQNHYKLLKLLAFGAGIFFVYSFFRFLPYKFNPGAAAEMARPFFKDHTIFSSTMAMLVPLLLLFRKAFSDKPKWVNHFIFLLGLIGLLMVFLSSSRAAWVSLIAAGGLFLYIRMGWSGKRFVFLLLGSIMLFGGAYYSLKETLGANVYVSTGANSSLASQIWSVTNTSTDVSNLERLNRWKCAVRMFEDKPFRGFGPGTFQFQYLPYQRESEMTVISVTDPNVTKVGRGGSAHSEYLLALSEMGILGALVWMSLIVLTFYKGFKNLTIKNQSDWWLSVSIWLGLTTYFVHGFFNNFLNDPKTGFIFWFFVGVLLTLSPENQSPGDGDSLRS